MRGGEVREAFFSFVAEASASAALARAVKGSGDSAATCEGLFIPEVAGGAVAVGAALATCMVCKFFS